MCYVVNFTKKLALDKNFPKFFENFKIIFFFFQNKKLPDGQEEIEGTELSFKNVDRHHSGLYICKADNGYGKPATQKIHVTVGYVPEVEVEEYFIHAAESQKVELVCSVHAEPHATVKWFKNSVELTGDTNTLQKHGHRHTLTIPTVTDSDFGNYTCRACNIHGCGEKNLEVSGKYQISITY